MAHFARGYCLFVPITARPFPPWTASTRRRSSLLLTWLLGEPLVEHRSREADVPTDPMARQATSAHRLIDPARLDVEIPSCLLRAKEPVLRQGGRRLWCCWWSLHTPTDPQARRPAKRFARLRVAAYSALFIAQKGAGTTRRTPGRPQGGPLGNRWGNRWPHPTLLLLCFSLCLQGFERCRRRDSN